MIRPDVARSFRTTGPLLLLILALLLPARAAAQDVATVRLKGAPVLTVAAAESASAAVRARSIEEKLNARLANDAPLAPIDVVTIPGGAALMVGGDTLVVVGPRDAEASAERPLQENELARAMRRVGTQWAESLSRVFADYAASERARVVVEGNPLFEVTGSPELRAPRRAASVGLRIGALATAEAEPPPIKVLNARGKRSVVAGSEVLVEITPADARANGTDAAELARSWAAQIDRTVELIRSQRSGSYVARVAAEAVAALALVVILSTGLRRLRRRIEAREPAEGVRAWGLLPVFAGWFLAVVQFLLWVTLLAFVLWSIPSTRPLTFAAGARLLAATRAVGAWLLGPGIFVALIVLVTVFIARFAGSVVRYLTVAYGAQHGGRTGLRAGTFAGILAGSAQVVVYFLGIVAVLAQLKIDPVPLLASAGVAGIALGFGVQSLIKDFFTGIFILYEDQYGVGDVVRIGEVSGKVERFTLRITQLRSIDGSVSSIPNGQINTVTNLSKDWAQAVLDINVAMDEDMDRVTAVIAETAKALADEWRVRIKGEPEVLGVERIDPLAQAVTLRVLLRTAPLEQWAVQRELRRRVLDAFHAAGIQVPPGAAVSYTAGATQLPGSSPA